MYENQHQLPTNSDESMKIDVQDVDTELLTKPWLSNGYRLKSVEDLQILCALYIDCHQMDSSMANEDNKAYKRLAANLFHGIPKFGKRALSSAFAGIPKFG
jgi:hypothetical protein